MLASRNSGPIVSQLAGPGENHRPHLTPESRQRLLPHFADDIHLLSRITGEDFGDWLSTASRGSFLQRSQAPAPGATAPA